MVRATAYITSDIIQFNVDLAGIPQSKQGQEVIVTFNFFDFDNNNTFYTDSNGLEMQKRILDQRPDWTLETNQHISANYYPINSAISMIDPFRNLQVTVMNDRAQGGSVIESGTIEFMQNRRLYYDDNRGVGEPLCENDTLGNSISVPATYYL